MAGRASIVGAAETSVGKVREHNEDSHFIDPDRGIFLVCDGMGGHAAGEVASALAVSTIRDAWGSDATQAVADSWLDQGTPEARKRLMATITDGVLAAHDAILDEAKRDRTKGGMGTTLVGALVVGGDVVFAHCGDSRAYLVRDGIAMQLTEDHTLLARLLAAGVDVDVNGDGARFKSMLTNALGIGEEVKVSTFVVPLADGDRFLLCSDGITEYLQEAEIGEVLCKQPSPARAAQRLVEIALARGGGDNATALVVRVLEAGETARPAELILKEDKAIHACALWAKVSPQQRLRALRIALPRDHVAGERVPAVALGDRVAWIIVDGEVDQDGEVRGPGALIYPEALLADRPLPDKDSLAVTRGEAKLLAMRADDFRELCEDDPELGEALLEALATELASRKPSRRTGRIVVSFDADSRGNTDPGEAAKLEAAGRAATPPQSPAVDSTEPLPDLPVEQAGDDVIDDEPVNEDATVPGGIAAVAVRRRRASGTLPPPMATRAPSIPPERAPSEDGAPTEPVPIVPPTRPLAAKSAGKLIVPANERAAADAALDDALSKLTLDQQWADLPDEATPPPAEPPRAPPAPEDDEPVIVVEAEPPPAPIVAPRPARKPTALGDHSEVEIQIEELAAAPELADGQHGPATEPVGPATAPVAPPPPVDHGEPIEPPVVEIEADAPDEPPADDHVEMIVEQAHDKSSGRVVEILKDTSSQQITMTVDQPSDAEIVVVAEAIDSAPPPRPKRHSDTHD